MIAYSRVWWESWEQEGKGERIYTFIGLLVPAWRRKGIGTAMIRHAERRLREIASQHPADAPQYLQRGVVESEVGLETLLRREGYEPIRHDYSLVRPASLPVPEAPMPAGLEVRPVRPEHVRQIMAADDEAFRDHWGYEPLTEDKMREWMEDPRFDPALWKVAWDGDEVAGGVLGFVDHTENEQFHRKRGYTEDIWVRRPWRRRGLARALLAQSIQMFIDMGMEETAHGVDTQNPHGALDFYESMGYRPTRHHTTYRKSL